MVSVFLYFIYIFSIDWESLVGDFQSKYFTVVRNIFFKYLPKSVLHLARFNNDSTNGKTNISSNIGISDHNESGLIL